MSSRRNKCPQCGKKLSDLFMDFDAGTLHCAHCMSDLEPDQVVTNWTVDYFAKLIPEEQRDAYLSKLGFERKPIHRTSPLVLGFLIGIVAIPVLIGVLVPWDQPSRLIGPALGTIAFIFAMLMYYRDEKKPRWKRKSAA